jgi:hypothetical protein
MLRIQHTKSPGQRRPGLQMHSEEVSSEGSLAESLSCAKECGRRPHAILVAEPLKLIKPLQHPGRSGISCHRSRCIIECQRHESCGQRRCSGLDGESRKAVRAFFVVFGGQHCRLREMVGTGERTDRIIPKAPRAPQKIFVAAATLRRRSQEKPRSGECGAEGGVQAHS